MIAKMQKKREITDGDVRHFHSEMGRRFHGSVIDKDNAIEMKIVANVLDTIRLVTGRPLPSAQEFMQNYATTLLNRIYIPPTWDAATRLSVGVHEFTHVDQLWHGEFEGDEGIGGSFGFAYLYLTEDEARIRLEQRALRAQWEVNYIALGQPLPSPKDMTEILEGGYALSPTSLQLAEDLADLWITEVHYGKVDTETGIQAIKLLRTMGVCG